jgi:hypothetical protein
MFARELLLALAGVSEPFAKGKGIEVACQFRVGRASLVARLENLLVGLGGSGLVLELDIESAEKMSVVDESGAVARDSLPLSADWVTSECSPGLLSESVSLLDVPILVSSSAKDL